LPVLAGQAREVVEGVDGGGTGELGQEVRAHKAKEALDLALGLWGVGSRQNALDAEGGAGGVELVGAVDAALVGVDGHRAAVAGDGPFETVLQAGELLVPVELGVGYQPGVIVEEGEEKGLSLGLWVGGVSQLGAVEGVRLPQVAEMLALEAAKGSGTLGEACAGSAAGGQVAAQGARSDALFANWAGILPLQDVHDGARGAGGQLAFEGLGAVQGFGREGA